jgi:heme/copper-type cytochrome/quinol oxidase subunit 1
MSSRPAVGVRLVRIASVYLLAGLVLGLAMGIGKDFSLMSVHSHVLLLGWATLALTGIVYLVLPRCAGSRLAAAHFWLHNLGLPVMVAALAAETLGMAGAERFIGLGSTVVVAGLGLFTLNVLRNAGAPDAARA